MLKLGKVARRVHEHYDSTFGWSEAVVDHIVSRCTEVDTGARNVDHILTKTLLPEMSSEFLSRLAEGGTIQQVRVGVGGDGQFQYEVG